MDFIEVDGHFEIKDPSKIRPKKITGTRLASVLGLNRWNTPFQTWCEITKAYVKPFEDTKYTLAGKAIEPKQLRYLKDEYGFDVVTPSEWYGEDYFNKTHGDFFSDKEIFGGMWDGRIQGDEFRVIECKTTKRAEDWLGADGKIDPPMYYKMQACLYAWLLDWDNVTMIVSFLEDDDYADAENFEVTDENTAVCNFKINDFWDFEEVIEEAVKWWNKHVVTGVSPKFDEHLDKEYLTPLRTKLAPKTEEVDALLEELRQCNTEIEKWHAKCDDQEKRAAEIKKQLKAYAEENIGDKNIWEYDGDKVKCKLSTSWREGVNTDALKDDGLYEKYSTVTKSTRFTVSFE